MQQLVSLKKNGLCAYVKAFAAYVAICSETYVEIWAQTYAGAYAAYWRDYVGSFGRFMRRHVQRFMWSLIASPAQAEECLHQTYHVNIHALMYTHVD